MQYHLLLCCLIRKDMLDEALLRPGRLEVHVEIGLPDEQGRLQILKARPLHACMLMRRLPALYAAQWSFLVSPCFLMRMRAACADPHGEDDDQQLPGRGCGPVGPRAAHQELQRRRDRGPGVHLTGSMSLPWPWET